MRSDSPQLLASAAAASRSPRKIWKYVTFCLTLACLFGNHILYALPAATTTTLALSSGGKVGNGVVVTFTAVVTGGKGPISPGFVTFCDASAKFCEDLAVLGTTAVNSSGVASMKKVLPPGLHKISAFFDPTVTNATSVSSIQTVDVPYVKAVPVPIITKIGTSNPLPIQASVSVVGTAALTGTLSIVQTQGNQALVSASIPTSKTVHGFGPLVATKGEFSGGSVPVAGDFDGDGLLDLVSTGYDFHPPGANTYFVQVSLNDPAHPGQFLPGQEFNAGIGDPPIVGDFNNDGTLDLLLKNNFTDYSYTLFPGDPAHPGQFLTGSDAIYTPSNATLSLVADLNQDGVLDLLGEDKNGDIEILFGDPSHPGHFINETTIPNDASVSAVADMNGDGVLDIIGPASGTSVAAVQIRLGDATHPGHFLAPVTYPVSAPYFLSGDGFLVGDFNQDGLPDVGVLVGGNDGAGTFYVLLNNASSPGQLQTPVSYPVTQNFPPLLGDFNGGGALDMAQEDYPTGLSCCSATRQIRGPFCRECPIR